MSKHVDDESEISSDESNKEVSNKETSDTQSLCQEVHLLLAWFYP